MKLIRSIALPIFSLIILSSSCKKHVIQPINQLSLLPAATQTGANTFGCLVNGQAFVPKNRSLLQGPIMQCNYIYTLGGYYFDVSGGNSNSNGTPVSILIQTDSLTIKDGQTLPLTGYAIAGEASGTYITSASSVSPLSYFHTNSNASGQLNITHMDTIKQIVSGTFYFTAVNNGDTVKITNGRFDMPYTR
jgi:hypothetical protein